MLVNVCKLLVVLCSIGEHPMRTPNDNDATVRVEIPGIPGTKPMLLSGLLVCMYSTRSLKNHQSAQAYFSVKNG